MIFGYLETAQGSRSWISTSGKCFYCIHL